MIHPPTQKLRIDRRARKRVSGTLLKFVNSFRLETTAHLTGVPFAVEDEYPSLDEGKISIRQHMLYLSGRLRRPLRRPSAF